MSAISQQDWQDQEDGRALRELDAMLDHRDAHFVLQRVLPIAWEVRIYSVTDPRADAGGHYGATPAEAAREAMKSLL